MKTNFHIVLKTICFLGVVRLTMATQITMKKIREDDALLRSHIKQRPVAIEKVAPFQIVDETPKIMLNMSVAVLAMMGLVEVSQLITTTMFLTLSWEDPLLAWDPRNYSDVYKVQMPVKSIWTPDLRVLNGEERTTFTDSADSVILFYDGSVSLLLPFITRTQCVVDLTYYPYDEQKCQINFHSFDSELMVSAFLDESISSLVTRKLDLGNEWDIKKTEIKELIVPNVLEDMQTFPSLVLTIKRRSTFYTVCLVLPLVVTSYMNTLVFLLPLQSGERISFLVSIFVSTSVFISYFVDMMPRGLVKTPNVMILMTGTIVESVLIFLGTILVLRQYHKQQADDPANGQNTHGGRRDSAQSDLSPYPTTRKAWPDGRSLLRKLCCTKCQALISTYRVSSTPGRSPADVSDNQQQQASRKVMEFTWKMKLNYLDNFLFGLAFICNSIFLIVIFVVSQPL